MRKLQLGSDPNPVSTPTAERGEDTGLRGPMGVSGR